MRLPTIRLAGLLAVALSARVVTLASAAENAPESNGLNPETRKAVVAEMKRILEQTKLTEVGAQPTVAELVPQPVLNWDDVPRGHHYGTLWVWGATGRPAAIVEMYTVNFAREIDRWPGNVLHSLSTRPLQAEADFRWDWAPEQPGFTPQPLAGAPVPAATRTACLLQMRALAKRFSAQQTWQGDRAVLRLLPTPVWQYESAGDRVFAGGLFVFSHGGTNPEVVLVLEALQDDPMNRWQYGCVRLGHAQMSVAFDDQEVWNVPTYDAINPRAPYYWIAKP